MAHSLARHGRSLMEIGAVSIIGIIATAGFQIVATRGLGPESFGLLASFLALINVASIGSSALRNSVAVAVAKSSVENVQARSRSRWRDSSLFESLMLGAVCTALVLALSPLLAKSLASNWPALIITAAAITPYFVFSRSQGLLQGVGKTRAVVWWSTGAQLAQLVLTVTVLVLGFGALGILASTLLVAVVGTIGASYQARDTLLPPGSRPFTRSSIVVLLLTLSFAWLTNSDVIYVRAGADAVAAGSFAAAAVLVKTTLILPSTLSLYLLPRFVRRRNDEAMTKLGVNVTVGITLLGGLAILFVLWIAGDLIVSILFGDDYKQTVQLLPLLALCWIPWALTQAILVRITAASSLAGLVVLFTAAITQVAGALTVLPDIKALIIVNGVVGVAVFTALFLVHLRLAGKSLTVETA